VRTQLVHGGKTSGDLAIGFSVTKRDRVHGLAAG
jgi:hypothetical protein